MEAFLGRVTDPHSSRSSSEPEIDGALRAIMFTDIVGSTRITERLGDRMAVELVRAHDSIVRSCLKKFSGCEVKHTGDGIMASFTSVTAAVDCAIAVQSEFQRYNAGNPEPIHVRVGLDCGEPVEDSKDLFGSSVQLASRLCNCSTSDEILVSENVGREYAGTGVFEPTEPLNLKGFSKPVRAFRCIQEGKNTAAVQVE